MHTFTVPIGDWSGDGHELNEKFIVQCSHTPDACREAYIKSCELTGYQFHDHSPYTHPYDQNGPCTKGFPLFTEFEDNAIPKDAAASLKAFGLDLVELLDVAPNADVYVSPEECLTILMAFIGLTIHDYKTFEWKTIKSPPCLFGYWNKDLNIQIGYGLFD